jgi:2-isopropylmalate synthase
VEEWDLDGMLKHTRDAVRFSVSHGCPAMYVTEDTTRSRRETLQTLLSEAVECGATRVCLCDTVGHALPNGVQALVRFVRDEVLGPAKRDIKIDWHGHSDRGFSLVNSLAAIEAGADRVHATALGIGERAGNTPMDLLLVNLRLLGIVRRDLRKLREYTETVAKYCGYVMPANYPVVGADAFRTGTGVHAAAIIKCLAKDHDWLVDEVYSGVPAGDFGYEQVIEIGPMSGKSNVQYWLKRRGIEPHPKLVDTVFDNAKKIPHLLTDVDVYRIIVEQFVSKNAPGGGGSNA